MRGLLYTPLPALQKPTVFYDVWILGWYETSLLPKNGRQLRGIDHFIDDDLHHFGVIDTINIKKHIRQGLRYIMLGQRRASP